jgi:hypothetical protein
LTWFGDSGGSVCGVSSGWQFGELKQSLAFNYLSLVKVWRDSERFLGRGNGFNSPMNGHFETVGARVNHKWPNGAFLLG